MLDKTAIVERVRRLSLALPTERPCLLFGAANVPELRERAARRSGLLDGLHHEAQQLRETDPDTANSVQPYLSSAEAVQMANAHVLTGEESYAKWAKRRVMALLAMDTWFSPVHVGGCRVCDHVMANVAAQVALVHDLAYTAFSPSESAAVTHGLRRLHFEPFLDATGDDPEWWFRPDMPSNWKIMTCGDSGLTILGYAEQWPGANEALARAAKAVIEVLDDVPPEGDWPEGIGYWFGTLYLGLRFARALRRVTDGEVNLFEHPALRVTGDFAAMLFAPSGRVYHFNDNNPEPSANVVEALAMLASEQGRGDWMAAARQAPVATPLFLACDDSRIASTSPTRRAASFPTTGVATLRTGWDSQATFAGFKSGPSDVGHSHLDANSFVLESRGRPLVVDQRYWPQAHFLGFFDSAKLRWNFDGMATVGHSTLLVDGQGQTWGPDFPGRLLEAHDAGTWLRVAGDASRTYPGLLRKYIRTLVLLPPGTLVIRDLVECEGERHVERLLHYAGDMRTQGEASIVENDGVSLAVVPFLPNREHGWRVSDVARTSTYECSDTRQMVERTIRYRSYSPFRAASAFEFLFGLQVDGDESVDEWRFEPVEDGWRLHPPDSNCVVRPDGDGLTVDAGA